MRFFTKIAIFEIFLEILSQSLENLWFWGEDDQVYYWKLWFWYS